MRRIKKKIIKTYIDVISFDEAVKKIVNWAEKRESKYVAIINTDVVVKSWLDLTYREITNSSDLSTPDGAPLALILCLYGYLNQKRITGPDLMEKLIPLLSNKNLKILFYGSTINVLEKIYSKIKKSFPNADIYFKSPPFRELTNQEEEEIDNFIKEINPHIIFVGLGCPKQDIWIFKKKKLINSVYVGIGAAFDFYAGTTKRAPLFMQNNGLEWLFRLYKNPKRLFIRYFIITILFPFGLFITILWSLTKNLKSIVFDKGKY